jgi:hypothetical protein
MRAVDGKKACTVCELFEVKGIGLVEAKDGLYKLNWVVEVLVAGQGPDESG